MSKQEERQCKLVIDKNRIIFSKISPFQIKEYSQFSHIKNYGTTAKHEMTRWQQACFEHGIPAAIAFYLEENNIQWCLLGITLKDFQIQFGVPCLKKHWNILLTIINKYNNDNNNNNNKCQ